MRAHVLLLLLLCSWQGLEKGQEGSQAWAGVWQGEGQEGSQAWAGVWQSSMGRRMAGWEQMY
jgi:hypothetical protein